MLDNTHCWIEKYGQCKDILYSPNVVSIWNFLLKEDCICIAYVIILDRSDIALWWTVIPVK